jgi:hypothetical protein
VQPIGEPNIVSVSDPSTRWLTPSESASCDDSGRPAARREIKCTGCSIPVWEVWHDRGIGSSLILLLHFFSFRPLGTSALGGVRGILSLLSSNASADFIAAASSTLISLSAAANGSKARQHMHRLSSSLQGLPTRTFSCTLEFRLMTTAGLTRQSITCRCVCQKCLPITNASKMACQIFNRSKIHRSPSCPQDQRI